MDFGLSEEQQQLRQSARALLTDKCPTTAVRKAMASDDGYPRDLYAEIAKLGWNGLIVPEKFGGAELGMLDMTVLLEEGGYAAMPGPFLFSSVLAASALKFGATDEINSKWLTAIAEGKAIGTIAITDRNGSIDPHDLVTVAGRNGKQLFFNGDKTMVPYANIADFIVVVGIDSHQEIELGVIETQSEGVKISPVKNLDLTRRVSTVELCNAVGTRLKNDGKLYWKLVEVGSLAIAADSLGGMERSLQMAVEYSQVREQFGKPIGSFQALKHAAAEIVSELEPARALLWYAAYAFDAGLPDAARTIAMAKARLCDIYSRGSDRAVLMHGGIGFTWEHDMHLWFKRARFNESYFGSPAYHREMVAELGGY
jgi:alkylation response protein AidB-like acyl-CoA dehydrogenase